MRDAGALMRDGGGMMPMRRSMMAALLLVAAPALARAPGFDCARAARPDEKAICQSARLSALDARLADMFGQIQHCTPMGGRDVNTLQQRAWLRRRATCGADGACLARLYRARIARFAPHAARARRYAQAGDCPAPL